MGIYVPGAYMNGKGNSDGTYTCTPSDSGTVGSYTAKTAPVVLPVNTPGYSASAAPTEFSYDSVSDYLKAGFVYVQPGIRGRSSMSGTASSTTSRTAAARPGASPISRPPSATAASTPASSPATWTTSTPSA
jgi:hypothetical protein